MSELDKKAILAYYENWLLAFKEAEKRCASEEGKEELRRVSGYLRDFIDSLQVWLIMLEEGDPDMADIVQALVATIREDDHAD